MQSVERAALLLRAVAAASGPAGSASALAEAVGLNRTTTWRILEHPRGASSLVILDRETGCYSLGFGLIDLAGQAGGASLAQASRAVLQRVAAQTGETAALAVMRDGGLTYVAEAGAGSVVSAGWQGRQVSMHATSTGKAYVAFSPRRRARGPRRCLRARPVAQAHRHHDHLLRPARGRARPDPGAGVRRVPRRVRVLRLGSVGAGARRGRDGRSAIVSIWGPSERLTEARFEALGAIAVAAARDIVGAAPRLNASG